MTIRQQERYVIGELVRLQGCTHLHQVQALLSRRDALSPYYQTVCTAAAGGRCALGRELSHKAMMPATAEQIAAFLKGRGNHENE